IDLIRTLHGELSAIFQRWYPDMDLEVEEMPVATEPPASPCAHFVGLQVHRVRATMPLGFLLHEMPCEGDAWPPSPILPPLVWTPRSSHRCSSSFMHRYSKVSIRGQAWPCTAMAIWCWTSMAVSPTSETVAERPSR